MMRLASFGKLKKIQTSKSMDQAFGADQQRSPRMGRKSEKTSPEMRSPKGQNFISRLASMGSLKSKRSKSDAARLQACAVQTSTPRTVIHNAEVAELEMAFKVFDANGDGQICLVELGAVLRSLGGGDVTEEELQLIMNDVDKNQDGFISLEEFKDVHNKVGESGSPAEDPIREAFATFDKDGNNLICADELRAVLLSLGEKGHTLEDCRRMISNVDLDGDGFVNYKEFEHLLSSKS
ncbi:hypothetical protein M758_5G021300 [Ceratodon purpureus]|uniref:EF-hand domain-containing protein n=1 Tax=Ceratodon purpureus TaxID=3225 RepID=A0A8T0HYC4_CERPU|nr:hypothetical protein KC19_5G019100 [Ceratodon purpureus]KAG0615178.1 hypothetical protein M758_5G021300 [Ceratodon purpureus]